MIAAGYACMPLNRSPFDPVPPGWKMVSCPECGRDCFESDLCRLLKQDGIKALCTECALEHALNANNKTN